VAEAFAIKLTFNLNNSWQLQQQQPQQQQQ